MHDLANEVGIFLEVAPEVLDTGVPSPAQDSPAAGVVDLEKRHRHGLKEVLVARLALPKRLSRPLAILDVDDRSIPADNLSGFVTRRRGPKQEPTILTVEAPQARLGIDRLARGHILGADIDEVSDIVR